MSRKRDRSKEHSSPPLVTLQRRNCKLIFKYSELYRNRAHIKCRLLECWQLLQVVYCNILVLALPNLLIIEILHVISHTVVHHNTITQKSVFTCINVHKHVTLHQ